MYTLDMELQRPTLRPIRAVRPLIGVPAKDAAMLQLPVTQIPTRVVAAVNDLWLEVPLDDAWTAAYRLTVVHGKPEVSELRVFPTEPGFVGRPPGEWSGIWRGVGAPVPRRGLTTKLLSQVRVHLHLGELPAILEYFRERGTTQEQLGRFGLNLPTLPAIGSRRGRKPLSDAFLAGVARDYAAALFSKSKRPLRDVADLHETDIAVVRGWVHKARERRLLIGGAWGKAAGALSPAALILLRRTKRNSEHTTPRRSRRRSIRGK